MFERFYIDKNLLLKILIVVAIIGLLIISVKVRVSKNQKALENGKVNYVTHQGENGTMVIVDFDKVTKYFTNEADAEPFKEQIANFIISQGSEIKEWYTEEVVLDRNERKLTFTLSNKETHEFFLVTKTNETTKIVHEYEKQIE